MEITAKRVELEKAKCEALVIGVPQDATQVPISGKGEIKKFCDDVLALKDFRGKLNETLFGYPPKSAPARRVVLVGLGETERYDLERARQAVGSAAKLLLRQGVSRFAVAVDTFVTDRLDIGEIAQAVSEAVILATYQYTHFKEIKPEDARNVESVELFYGAKDHQAPVEEGVRWGQFVANAANFTRDLQNHPGNWATPTRLAEVAQDMAREVGLSCEVLEKSDMEKLGMGALLGVAQGSAEPPKFIILEHKPDQDDLETLVFVGKGITFDSGGISIKPSEKMEDMKFDMSGGAAVLGAMKAIAELGLAVHAVGLIPATENLPSGTSMKPGDILRGSSGRTIEIINTDAEGRLILSDALTYAKRYKPKAVVDLATLTGSCVVALGHYASGLMGRDADLIERIKGAGEKTGERVWELPLWDDYFEDMKSDYADIKNSGPRWGGAITAAAFLGNFTEDYPWAHLDIAGTAWTDKEKPYLAKGGTAVGVRLLVQFVSDWLEGK